MKLRSRTAGMAAMLSLIALLGTGCSLTKSNQTSQQIDPPQQTADDAAAPSDVQADPNAKTGSTQVTLYFRDPHGYVAPLSMGIPNDKLAVAKRSLEYMVEDGPEQAMLPKGFSGLLPKGTKVLGLNITQDHTAIVDFSKEFTDYNAQDERHMLEAITYTLTGFPSVENVQLRVEGKVLTEMPVDATPLDQPLTRAMGVNLELAQGVDAGQSMPVTVFFFKGRRPIISIITCR